MGDTGTRRLETADDGSWIDAFAGVGAAALILALVMLRGRQYVGANFNTAVVLGAVAYAVAVGRRQWMLLTAGGSILLGAGVSFLMASVAGVAWTTSPIVLAFFVLVWMPWPEIRSRAAALQVLWPMAVAPVVMLLLGPPWGDVSWVGRIWDGERLRAIMSYNEIGIPAAMSVLAAMALRLDRDTWPRYAVLVVGLVLAAAPGTRTVVPGLLVAAVLWFRRMRTHGIGRGPVIEAVPLVLYALVAARPLVWRTVSGLEHGLDEASTGRIEILRAYWERAVERPWTGRGIGATERLAAAGEVARVDQPHNGLMTLLIDVGVLGMLVVTVGLVVYVLALTRRVDGEGRWLLRVPLVLFLPALFLLDLGLYKPLLVVPIMLWAAVAPWLSRHLEQRRCP